MALQLTDKPTNNDGALVVEGSRGSDTASGSGDVEPSLPKYPWASKEAIRQEMARAKRGKRAAHMGQCIKEAKARMKETEGETSDNFIRKTRRRGTIEDAQKLANRKVHGRI